LKTASAAPASGERGYKSATALIAALADRKMSAAELVGATIDRIELLDGSINAVVVRDFERAREAAKAADQALAKGERQPLLGLPVTIKEAFNVAGLPTTWGNPANKGWVPTADALAVTRLKRAGAIVLGKTNVPFMLRDMQTYNAIYGTTNNPWDLSRTPGGSSGGSAASLAAGYVSLELGTDQGGSLRFPAHFCGVYGHKPSLDVVPMRGALLRYDGPYVGAPEKGSWVVAGPMARSAADLALELKVLAGPDEMAHGTDKLTLLPARHDNLKDFRVLLLDTLAYCPTSEAVRTSLDRLVRRLGRSGCRVLRTVPGLPDLSQTVRTYVELDYSSLALVASKDELDKYAQLAKTVVPADDSLQALRLRAIVFDGDARARAGQDCLRLLAQWRKLFDTVDVVLCPVVPVPAFKHDHEPDLWKRKILIDGKNIDYLDLGLWTTIASMTGLPATVAPVGFSSDGLPIGVQIIGPYLCDKTTIAFAHFMEREYGGFIPPRQPG
jgi:amidase